LLTAYLQVQSTADRLQDRGVSAGQIAGALLVATRGLELRAESEMVAVDDDPGGIWSPTF